MSKRALISVSDKTGIENFARALVDLKFEIISTGGTSQLLKNSYIPVTDISQFTGFPEILGGRVKTLHPKVYAGLLARRNDPEHMKQIEKLNIPTIDIVVVNLYPFSKVISRENVHLEEAIENIDIGGPTALRAASKNYESVGVIVDPGQYEDVIKELKSNNGELTLNTKFKLACYVFKHTSQYDNVIYNFLANKAGIAQNFFPEELNFNFKKVQDLRYGENPHQKAAFYKEIKVNNEPCITNSMQLQGKELSFNNILDANAALEIIKEYNEPACVIIKHNNPCGVALGKDSYNAFVKAFATDPVSAFGGVISFNCTVDKNAAEKIIENFVEIVIAPQFTDAALTIFKAKSNVRLLELGEKALEKIKYDEKEFDIKKVVGGLLIQDRDIITLNKADLKIVTKRIPTEKEMNDLIFAWKVCKHVKSNAIVYARDNQTVGIGAGQMSRVDSSKLAVMKAQLDIKGTVLASDAFFPFRDGIDAAHKAGATAVIQPGGSQKDKEVIEACNEYDMAMIFTNIRHFKH